MKKFLVSLIIGITMMAIGTTMLVFEIRDFEFVDEEMSGTSSSTWQSKTISIGEDRLRIVLDDDHDISYYWKYDESMGDDIRIEYSSRVQLSQSNQTIYVRNDHNHEWTISKGIDVLDSFLDGLKEHKIYTWTYTADIVITSSSATRDRVYIDYD